MDEFVESDDNDFLDTTPPIMEMDEDIVEIVSQETRTEVIVEKRIQSSSNSKILRHLQYYLLRQNATLVRKLSHQANTATADFDTFKRWMYQDLEEHRKQLKEASKNLIFRASQDECDDCDVVVTFVRDCDAALVKEFVRLLSNDHPLLSVRHCEHHYVDFTENAVYITAEEEFFDSFAQLSSTTTTIDNIENLDSSAQDDETDSKYTSLQRQSLLFEVLQSWQFFVKSSTPSIVNLGELNDSANIIDIDSSIASNYPLLSRYLSNGENIFETLREHCIVAQMFPMHEEKALNGLKQSWVFKFHLSQPLNDVCEYFGLKIAIYFDFIEFYTSSLCFPMLFGILVFYLPSILSGSSSKSSPSTGVLNWLLDWTPLSQIEPIISDDVLNDTLLFGFTIFNMFWSTIMLQKWKENCALRVKSWTKYAPLEYNLVADDEPMLRQRKKHETSSECGKAFKYFVTAPIIAACLAVTFMTMFTVFKFQTWLDRELIERQEYPEWIRFVPKVLLAIMISVSNYVYHFIAIILNDREKHSTAEVRENNLILKLVLYQFLNNFLPLFYLAFYLGDVEKLKEQLAAQLITRQVIGNFNESIWPFLKELYRIATRKLGCDADSTKISKGELESCMYPYESTFDDYLELIVQFGYVMLFAPVFPLAALCAFLNNLLEIRSDAFKLCFVYQRPLAIDRCNSIGQWENVLYSLSIIAIANNCALMVVTGQISRVFGFEQPSHILLTSVIIEHALMLMKWLIPTLI